MPLYKHGIGLFLLVCQDKIQAQDKINLKDGTVVTCQITEIQDFILYAKVHDDTFLATFFYNKTRFLKNTIFRPSIVLIFI